MSQAPHDERPPPASAPSDIEHRRHGRRSPRTDGGASSTDMAQAFLQGDYRKETSRMRGGGHKHPRRNGRGDASSPSLARSNGGAPDITEASATASDVTPTLSNITPHSRRPQQSQNHTIERPNVRRDRPRERRYGKGRQQPPNQPNISHSNSSASGLSANGPGRVFGAGLTQSRDGPATSRVSDAEEGLRADASEFVPGQASHMPAATDSSAATVGSGKPRRKPQRKGGKAPNSATTVTSSVRTTASVEKSTAGDMATRIHDDINHNIYECPVCTSEIGRRSRVWSCTHCWTVFHLTCIKKWANNEGAAVSRPRGEEAGDQQRQWRCPGCNLSHDTTPVAYSCWCEKETDPRPLPGLPPHSCGQTCSKSRRGCPHPCDSVCHAGPCPPCSAMGPTRACFCGRHEVTKKCVDTDYENGWSCGEVCGEYLPCMSHTCARRCHEGLCGACEERVDARCYCGKTTASMLCSAQDDEEFSQRYLNDDESSEGDMDEWTGTFACREVCGRLFDCGKHACRKPCHAQDAETPHCPQAPDMITHCPCGKTRLSDIDGFIPRRSCQETVPRCGKLCGKTLSCGHSCPMLCHSGACNPCFQAVMVKCRCGRSDFRTLCHQGISEPPQCMRVCKATLNCGRHACLERCCSGERKSLERLATKRKLRSLQSSTAAVDDFEAEHICTRVCARPLKCGQHTCPELCHKGPCASCREAIFDEIACACRRTIAYPPLPCGTKPPSCSYECQRHKPCGHPQTSHNCHPDDESCPKCPFLVDRRCMCGKKVMKNQPCHLASPRCGLICNEELKCGSHNCKKSCHAPGDCEDAQQSCQQACGKTKKLCPHPCTEKCHAPFPCPERPCETRIEVTCQCGRLKESKRCGMSLDKSRAGVNFVQPSLTCDDECARLERNRMLASALNVQIDPMTTNATTTTPGSSLSAAASVVPYSDETLDNYIALTSSTTLSTLQAYEQKLHDLAHNELKRSTRFTPARAALRAFVHTLAADWGFTSESFDPEPHRYVEVYKSNKWLPPAPLASPDRESIAFGIGGISVANGIRMRDRELARQRELKRATAAAATALKSKVTGNITNWDNNTAEESTSSGGGSGGWAQVARKKAGPADSPYGFTMPTLAPTGTSFGNGRFGALVLKSSLGRGKELQEARLAAKRERKAEKVEVADDWEQEADAEGLGSAEDKAGQEA